MDLLFNGKAPQSVNYNGSEVLIINWNGTKVWEKQSGKQYQYQVADYTSDFNTSLRIPYAYDYNTSKWYALNNLNQYEEWGIYDQTDDLSTITKYNGKLAVVGETEYQYQNGSWNEVGVYKSTVESLGLLENQQAPPTGQYFPTSFLIKEVGEMFSISMRVYTGGYVTVSPTSYTCGYNQGTVEQIDIDGELYYKFECPQAGEQVMLYSSRYITISPSPLEYYSYATDISVRYDKSIFNSFDTFKGNYYSSFDDVSEDIGYNVVVNVDGYLYQNNERYQGATFTYPASAFTNNTNITEVKLLDEKITSVPNYMFNNCTKLQNVELNDNITNIGNYAFRYCSSLTSVTIPSSVTSIGTYAFQYCTNLDEITMLSTTPPTLGAAPFSNVKKFGTLIYPQGSDYSSWLIRDWDTINTATLGAYGWNMDKTVTVWYSASTTNKTVSSYTFSDGVTKEQGMGGGYAYKILIGKGITKIGDNSFKDLVRMTQDIYMSDDVEEIGYYGIYRLSGYTSVYLSKNIKTLSDQAITNANSSYPYWVYINSDIPITHPMQYQAGRATWQGDGTTVYGWHCNYAVVNSGYKTIADEAFKQDIHISGITLPNTLETIGKNAFSGCTNLRTISIPSSVKTIGDYAFEYCKSATTINVQGGDIGQYAFYGCSGATSLTLGSNVTSIGVRAFAYCNKVTSLKIPSSVKTIGNYAFIGNGGFTSVTWNSQQQFIQTSTFGSCTALQVIDFSGGATQVMRFGSSATSTTVGTNTYIPTTVQYIVVPDNLYNSWKASTYWSNYTDKIISKSAYNAL